MIFLLMVNLGFLWMMRKNKKRANWVSEVDGTLSILKVHYEVVRDQDSRTFPFIFCFLFIYLFIFILAKKILNGHLHMYNPTSRTYPSLLPATIISILKFCFEFGYEYKFFRMRLCEIKIQELSHLFFVFYLFIFILAKKILNGAIFICTTQHQELTLVSFLQQSFPF
jgi:hypothetical protein